MNEDELLSWKSFTYEAIQTFVSKWYKRTLLYHGHCATLAGHPRTRMMYHVFRRRYYWLYMASAVHEFVFKCDSCRRHRSTQKHQRKLQLFLPSELLEFVVIDILPPLTKTKQKNRFIIVMTDSCSKLTRAISIAMTTAPRVAMVVFGNRIMPYVTPNTIVTDNGLQFVSEFFVALCVGK